MIQSLFQEKTKMILTVLAIAWGTFTISSMLAVGEGLKVTFEQAVANAGYNLLSISGGRTSKNYLGTHANQPVSLTWQDERLIKQLPNIQIMTPVNNVSSAEFNIGAKTLPVPLSAVNQYYSKIHSIDMQYGRFLNAADIARNAKVVVLGVKSYDDFFPDQSNPVGKRILINGSNFLIVGIMKDKTQLAGTSRPDIFSNWIPISTYRILSNSQTIDSISITYKNSERLDQLKRNIYHLIALNHHVDPNDKNILNFDDIANQQKTITRFFLGLQVFLGIVGALTLMVAGIGIANVMYASVSRSTAQIGIRMAVGAKAYQIFSMFVMQSLVATMIGGLLGVLLSVLFVIGMRTIPMHGKLVEMIGKPLPVLSWDVIFVVIFVLGLMGFLAGLFPAMKAASIDPAEALTYE